MLNKITSLTEYLQKYKDSIADPEGFWSIIAESHFWRKKWDKVLDWRFDGPDAPDVKWFVNGKLNITGVSNTEVKENIKNTYQYIKANEKTILNEKNSLKNFDITIQVSNILGASIS